MTYPLKVKVKKCRAHQLDVFSCIILTVMLGDGYGGWVTRERYSFEVKGRLISRAMRVDHVDTMILVVIRAD